MRRGTNHIQWIQTLVGFAIALSFTTLDAQAGNEPLGGLWDYTVQHDDMGKLRAAHARLSGLNDAMLWLSCSAKAAGDERSTSASVTATVSQKHYLGASDARGRVTVFWFDHGVPEVAKWVYQKRLGQMRDTEIVKTFMNTLTTSRQLWVELADYRHDPRLAEFRLDPDKTRSTIEKIRQDCQSLADP